MSIDRNNKLENINYRFFFSKAKQQNNHKEGNIESDYNYNLSVRKFFLVKKEYMGCANSCAKDLLTAEKGDDLRLQTPNPSGRGEVVNYDPYVERLTAQKTAWEELITNQKYSHKNECRANQNTPFGDESPTLVESEVSTPIQGIKNVRVSSPMSPYSGASSMRRRIDPSNLEWALKYARISPDDEKYKHNSNRIIKGYTTTLVQCIPFFVEKQKTTRRKSRSSSSSKTMSSPRENKMLSLNKRGNLSSSHCSSSTRREDENSSGKGGSEVTDLQGGMLPVVIERTAHGEVRLHWTLMRLLETTSVSVADEAWENVMICGLKIAQDAGLPLPHPWVNSKSLTAISDPYASLKRTTPDLINESSDRSKKRQSNSCTSDDHTSPPLPQKIFLGAMKVWRFGNEEKVGESNNASKNNQKGFPAVFHQSIEKCHHLVRRWRYLSAKCGGVLKCIGSEYCPEECETVTTPPKEGNSERHCFRVYMECCRFGSLQEYKEKKMTKDYGNDRERELTARAIMREVLLTLHQLHEENELQYEITTRSILLQFPLNVVYPSNFPLHLDCKKLDVEFNKSEKVMKNMQKIEMSTKQWKIPPHVQRILVPYCSSEKSTPSRSPCSLLSVDVPIDPLFFSKVPPLFDDTGDSWSTRKKFGAHECSVLPPSIKTSDVSNSPYGGISIQVDHKFSGPFVGYSCRPMSFAEMYTADGGFIQMEALRSARRENNKAIRYNSVSCVSNKAFNAPRRSSSALVQSKKYLNESDNSLKGGSCTGSRTGIKYELSQLQFSRRNSESLNEYAWAAKTCNYFEPKISLRSQSLRQSPTSVTRSPIKEENVSVSRVDLCKDLFLRNQEKLKLEFDIYMSQCSTLPKCTAVSESNNFTLQNSSSKTFTAEANLRTYPKNALPFAPENFMGTSSLPLPMILEPGTYKLTVSDSFSCMARPRYCTRLMHSAALRKELLKASLIFNGGENTCSPVSSPNTTEGKSEDASQSLPISRDYSTKSALNQLKSMSIGTEQFVTPDHLAPEVLRGGECSEASDIYAWAMTFIELTSKGVSESSLATQNDDSKVMDSTKGTNACKNVKQKGKIENGEKDVDSSFASSKRVLKSLGISFTSLPACLPTHCQIPSVFVNASDSSSASVSTPSAIPAEIRSQFLKEWADNLRQYYDEQVAKESVLREKWEKANPLLFPRSFGERSHLKFSDLIANTGTGRIGYQTSSILRSSLPPDCRVINVRRLTHNGMVNLFPAPVPIPAHLSRGCRTVLQWCLQLDASRRPSASELLNAYYFQEEYEEEESSDMSGKASQSTSAAKVESVVESNTESLKPYLCGVGSKEEDDPLKPECN